MVVAAQIKVETKPWRIELPSRNIEIELTTVQSNYHVEMNPSDVGNQDRHIVQEVIKVSFVSPWPLLCGTGPRMQLSAWSRQPLSPALDDNIERLGFPRAGHVQEPSAGPQRHPLLQGAPCIP